MSHITPKSVILLPSSTLTASSTGNQIAVFHFPFKKARVRLNYGTGSGTSPTLNVYLQRGMIVAAAADLSGQVATGSMEWQDLAAFVQSTGTAGTQYAELIETSSVVQASKDAALTVSTAAAGPLGTYWRIKYVVGGTNPSFATVSVTAELIP